MTIDLQRFQAAYLEESAEHVAELESGLLALESTPADHDLLNAIFRSAHSIKGGAGTFGFTDVARFTHALESVLDLLREAKLPATGERIALLLRSTDTLRELLAAAAAAGAAPAGLEESLAALTRDAQCAGRPEASAAAAPAAAAGPASYTIRFVPSREVFRQGMDLLIVLEDLAALCSSFRAELDTANLPALAELDVEECRLAWRIELESERSQAELRDVFAFVEDGATLEIAKRAPSSAAEPPQARSAAAPAPSASIRVPVSKIDKLVDLVGEIVIAQSMIQDAISGFTPAKLPLLQQAAQELERNMRELQEQVMSVRMVPIASLFSRFPRLVHDIASSHGKQVELELSGQETELDKSVIERMSDPLTHLVRNAIDHGLESPAERAAAGKPATGTLKLAACTQGGKVLLQISDDGHGLDRERILRKAVEQGLVPAGANLPEAEIDQLIFRPGLSTAQTVSALSGRGVGMDVVKQNVEAVGGSVSIWSHKGRGTRFTIELPLTLAILDGLTLALGKRTFVLPLVSIVESLRPKPAEIKPVLGRGEVVMVRGELLPLVRMHALFGVADAVTDPCRGLVVIVESDGRRAALLVDELLGEQQVVIKSLDTHYKRVEGFLGATILGDGRVALILDVPALVRGSRRSGAEAEAELVHAGTPGPA